MSTTALPPNLSPAYQPRSFRGVSPYPAPPAAASSSSHKSGSRSVSAHRLEHPLPSRPTVPLPSAGPAPRLNAEPISGASTSASSSNHRVSASPAIGAYDERRGRSSGLRNEVKRGEGSDKGSREEGEVVEVSPEIKRAARDILKLFRKLPAPLPEFLPSTYLPEQAKKKKSTTPEGSFSEYVRSQRRATSTTTSSSSTSPHAQQHPLGASESSLGKRRRSSSPSNNRTPNPAVGLGLGLEMPIPKKSKSTTQLGSTAMTPSSSLPLSGRGPRSPELLRTASTSYVPGTGRASTPTKEIVSGYRPRAGSSAQGSPPSAGESKATWPRPRWGEAAILYAARAMKLKRHGDAHLGLNAKPEFAHLVRDDLLGLLCYTDAVLLWLYSYWADEQSLGRVRGSPYSQSQALRDFVRASWERYGREQAKSDREKEMVKGMIGLMYLIEAVIFHHLATQTIAALGSRTNHLVAASSTNSQSSSMNRAANGSTSAPAGASTTAVGPSPASTNDASPPNSLPDPSPHSASSTQSPELSAEISGMISSSSSQHHRASQYLLNSRHHLPLSRLRKSFPSTYDVALHSELADEALPAPNDALGAARKVDIDQLDTFIWPIELGMCAPGAHLSVFGRRLVEEFAKAEGKDWDVRHG